jgi:hypothetical protein
MTDTDARLWHPWLRINRVLRVMLQARWGAKASQVKAEFGKGARAEESDSAQGLFPTDWGRGFPGLRWFALNAPGKHADFSPRVRRESCSVPGAREKKSSGNARLCGTVQKD